MRIETRNASTGDLLAQHYAAKLSSPLPIEEVEAIECSLKQAWADRLLTSRMRARDACAFVDFFRTVGFTYKYKPYGVKISAPFGYSLFDLNPDQGFSFQVHSQPKLEAFHVLAVKPHGFVFVCSQEEWEAGGRANVEHWATGERPLRSPYACCPTAGDTIVISDSNVVHSAAGCVLEEYANCSTDAVVRLFDQNERRSLQLPSKHPYVEDLLQEGHTGLPKYSVTRSHDSWSKFKVGPDAPIIDVPGCVQGRRLKLQEGQTYDIDPKPDCVTSVVAASGALECTVAETAFTAGSGQIVTIPPGWPATLVATQDTTVAMHCVSTSQILQDWK